MKHQGRCQIPHIRPSITDPRINPNRASPIPHLTALTIKSYGRGSMAGTYIACKIELVDMPVAFCAERCYCGKGGNALTGYLECKRCIQWF